MNDYGEDRAKMWDDYISKGGMQHRTVKHMLVDYSRYHEVKLIEGELIKSHQDISKITILDYGCGVGDYGIHLLRAGAKSVAFYDFPRSVRLVKYRLDREQINNGKIIDTDKTQNPYFGKYDLIIFGEVLEHLDNPAQILQKCLDANVKFIFTSSYPYRSEDPEDSYWSNHDHDDKARLQIPECKKLLEQNYTYVKFDGELRLWSRM